MRCPVVVAEVAVGGTGGNDQVVVAQRGAVAQLHLAQACVDVGDVPQQRGEVGLLAQNVADRCCDGRGRQTRRGHLVEQGLEQVVVGLVHQRHIHRLPGQRLGRFQPAKTAADDEDAGQGGGGGGVHAPMVHRPWKADFMNEIGI